MAHDLYFTERLKEKLRKIPDHPLTVVSAPAGCGKTTTVQHFLNKDTVNARWYSAARNMPDLSFRWILNQLSAYDPERTEEIKKLGKPSPANVEEIAEILFELKVREPLYLVIDNFQLLLDHCLPQLVDAFAKHNDDGLHLVLIAQHFGHLQELLKDLEDSICYIQETDLLFTEEDLLRISVGERKLTDREAHTIYENTGGWAAAVGLSLRQLKEGNIPREKQTIDDLLYDCVWKQLNKLQHQALLQFSFFESISEKEAAALLSAEMGEQERWEFSRIVPLVMRIESRHEILIHEILRTYLQKQLAEEPEKERYYLQAGKVFSKQQRRYEAAVCFLRGKDYEAILAAEDTGWINDDYDGVNYRDLILETLRECPEDIQKRHILPVMRLVYRLYGCGAFGDFERQLQKIREWIPEEDRQLLGEWSLLSSFTVFSDPQKMKEVYLAAESLMEQPSQLFTAKEPFLFGCPSLLHLFYRKPGKLEETGRELEEAFAVYDRLCSDHAAGAAKLYEAEAALFRGRLDEAEMLSYEAACLAKNRDLTVSCAAVMVRGIAEIYRGERDLKKAYVALEEEFNAYAADESLQNWIRDLIVDLWMGLTLGSEDVPEMKRSLEPFGSGPHLIKYITSLIHHREYRQAAAQLKAMSEFPSVPYQAFALNNLAFCYRLLEDSERAKEYLQMALDLEKEDGIYLFTGGLCRKLEALLMDQNIRSRYPREVKKIRSLPVRLAVMEDSENYPELESDEGDLLTKREREVALLAARGMRNQEISQRLSISENTVKHHLKIVFQKLNIDRRSKLTELLK